MKPYYIDYSEFERYEETIKGRKDIKMAPYWSGLTKCMPQAAFGSDFIRLASTRYQNGNCAYCDTPMVSDPSYAVDCRKYEPSYELLDSNYFVIENLCYCPQCYWWMFTGLTSRQVWPGESSEGKDFKTYEALFVGKVKTFDLEEEELPIREVRLWLSKHPHHLANTNPFFFEKLMTDCFKDLYPESEVLHV